MDLKELQNRPGQRHPWESARLKAIKKIIGRLDEGIKVLDIGCGDGFVCSTLFSTLKQKQITAVDINLTEAQIQGLKTSAGAISYRKELPEDGAFDLTLLLDVIEHVEDDRAFLARIVDRHVARGGALMVTVPAFQSLYSSHDAYLGHHRRYRLKTIENLAKTAGLEIVSSGYLFGCLLLPKLLLYKILRMAKGSDGIGSWHAGATATALIEKLLHLENSMMILAAKVGVKLPGLTGWVLCRRQA